MADPLFKDGPFVRRNLDPRSSVRAVAYDVHQRLIFWLNVEMRYVHWTTEDGNKVKGFLS